MSGTMTAGAPPSRLDALRRSIDEIDDAMLSLLMKRFALVEEVKAAKTNGQKDWPSPLRPAREMQILKRLHGAAGPALPPGLLVRLWRGVVTEASLAQAPVTIHLGRKLAHNVAERLAIADGFGRFAVSECKDEAQALVQVNVNPSDIAIVETQSNWIEAFLAGKAGKAQVIGVLPVLRDKAEPGLLVFGVAPAEATGEDETLLVSKGSLPRDFVQPLWQLKSGPYRLSALAGFYSEHESPLVSLMRSNPGLGLRVAGRYPSPIAPRDTA
jgi:chorismate mutase / prephenate dehydratase